MFVERQEREKGEKKEAEEKRKEENEGSLGQEYEKKLAKAALDQVPDICSRVAIGASLLVESRSQWLLEAEEKISLLVSMVCHFGSPEHSILA